MKIDRKVSGFLGKIRTLYLKTFVFWSYKNTSFTRKPKYYYK